MKNTYVFTEDKPIISNRVYGYQQIGDKYFCYDYYVLTTGDGGIYSCIDDTACIYAFGWFTLEEHNKKVVFHLGQLGGFTNIMIKLPEDKLSIIILTNYFRDSFQKIFKDVHDCVTETNIEYGNNDNMNKNGGK